jgi:hypothetical protein
MKLYTFLNENGTVYQEVRAENHDEAVKLSGGWNKNQATPDQDFYSEAIED